MNAFAMRNVTGPYAGDVWECSRPQSREDYEAFRASLGDPDAFEVVELDDNGQVIERVYYCICGPDMDDGCPEHGVIE